MYRDVEITTLDFPYALSIAPAGSADMVLTFRNAHNWVNPAYGAQAAPLAFNIYGMRCRHRRYGMEANAQNLPVGTPLHDTVIYWFPLTPVLGQVAVDTRMQLPDHINCDRHVLACFVDELQGVAVTRDLLFRSIARPGVMQHQVPDTRLWRRYPFQTVG